MPTAREFDQYVFFIPSCRKWPFRHTLSPAREPPPCILPFLCGTVLPVLGPSSAVPRRLQAATRGLLAVVSRPFFRSSLKSTADRSRGFPSLMGVPSVHGGSKRAWGYFRKCPEHRGGSVIGGPKKGPPRSVQGGGSERGADSNSLPALRLGHSHHERHTYFAALLSFAVVPCSTATASASPRKAAAV
jgi:hypothetical protein